MDVYLMLWVIIHCYSIVLRLSQFWLLGTLSVGSCFPETYPHYCGVSFEHFSLSQGSTSSSFVFLAPALQSTLSSRSHVCFLVFVFYWRMVLEIKAWKLGVFTMAEVPFLGPLTWQSKGIYVCIVTCVYKYVWMDPSVSILSWTWVHSDVSGCKLWPCESFSPSLLALL